MGGILDFLFEGRPPASVTTYGQTVQNVPSWLSDYTQGLIARANTVAAEPYQAYQGPRIADFSPLQTQAQNLTAQNVGSWSPYTGAAKSGYESVLGGPGALSQAAPYTAQAQTGYQGVLGGPGAASSAIPYTSAAQGIYQGVAGGPGAAGAASPYSTAAKGVYEGVLGGPGALSQASPYLQSGTKSYTDQVQDYMNPYVQNVIDRSTDLASRKLQEQLMPAINSNFIRSGAYGSAGQQRAVGQALRDVTGELQSQSRAALSDAYTQGAALQGTEAQRQLQAGQLAGSLYGQDVSSRLQAGQGLGALGQLAGSLSGQDITSRLQAGQGLGALGQITGSLSGQDVADRLQASQGLGTLGQLSGNLYNQDMASRLQASQGIGGLGAAVQGMQGTDTAALAAAGADQQGQTQKNLDLAYQDFLAQRGYPQQQVNWMSSIINGMPSMGGTTQTSQTGPAENYGPSGISQLASLYSLYRGVRDDWKGSARGGLARYAGGGRVKMLPPPSKPTSGGLAIYRRISNGR